MKVRIKVRLNVERAMQVIEMIGLFLAAMVVVRLAIVGAINQWQAVRHYLWYHVVWADAMLAGVGVICGAAILWVVFMIRIE